MERKAKYKRIMYILLVIGAALAAVKCIVVGLQRDEEYAITLSYRLINGDRLLTDVWDPHQTSAFLLSLLEYIYIKITGTTDYMILVIRVVATGIHLGISVFLYNTVRKITDKEQAFLLAVIYFAMLPKGYILPEFSLLMSWFTTLLVLLIVNVKMKSHSLGINIIYGAAIGIVMCMLVLSYPTCAVVFPIVLIFLFKDKQISKICPVVFTITCVIIGTAYLMGLLSYMSLSELFFNVGSVVTSCGSHGDSQVGEYLENTLVFAVITVFEMIVGAIVTVIFKRKSEGKVFCTLCFGLIAAVVLHLLYWITTIPHYDEEFEYSYFFVILVFGIACLVKNKENDREIKSLLWLIIAVNLADFIAIIALTNLNVFTSAEYLTSGIVFSLVALVLYAKRNVQFEKTVFVLLVVMAFVLTAVKGIFYNTDDGELVNITDIAKIIRLNGPARGIITDYMKGYSIDCTKEEWDIYIQDGDCVLVWDERTICYLNKDVKIGTYTTISTPTYDEESLLNYWEHNPDAYPDVIAVSCWFGEPKVSEYEWFYKWINNEYNASQVIDGKYYRYYIK